MERKTPDNQKQLTPNHSTIEFKPRKPGRPRKTLDLETIERLAGAGLTTVQLAACLNVAERTLMKYQASEEWGPQIRSALEKGRKRANDKVKEALFKRAVGYTWDKITHDAKVTKDGEIVPIVKRERVEVAPSEIAAMMWLSNKDPDNWKQKQDIGITQNTRVVAVELKNLDAEGRRNLIKQFEAERQRRLGAGKVQPSQTPIDAKFEEVPARIEKQGPEDAPGETIESAPDT